MEMFHWENLVIVIGLVKEVIHVFKDAQPCLYLISRGKDVSHLPPQTVMYHHHHHHLKMMKTMEIIIMRIGLLGKYISKHPQFSNNFANKNLSNIYPNLFYFLNYCISETVEAIETKTVEVIETKTAMV